jgi:hypothetical protein
VALAVTVVTGAASFYAVSVLPHWLAGVGGFSLSGT